MPAEFTCRSEPVQVGVCPTCAAPVKVVIRTYVYPAFGGQLVYRRYQYTCEGCGDIWACTKVPYYRDNSNDMGADPHYDYADALADFLELKETTNPRSTHI